MDIESLLVALGAGAFGALITALVSLRVERSRWRREDELRFIDLKRERYANYLRLADQYIADVGLALQEPGVPQIPQFPMEAAHVGGEIELLSVDVAVAERELTGALLLLREASVALGAASASAPVAPDSEVSRRISDVIDAVLPTKRYAFAEAARKELGMKKPSR